MNTENFEEFNNWFNSFLERNGGYTPFHKQHWFNKVEKHHQNIRKYLNGIKVQKIYNIEETQYQASKEEVYSIIDKIKTYIPYFMGDCGLVPEDLLLPTKEDGTHNVRKVAKLIRTYAEKHIRTSEIMLEIDKFLAALGNAWAKTRTEKSELEITLSTSAKSFCLLGHYGPDPDSCFRQGSDKTPHKFVLGQNPNTFVITISKFNEKKGKNINVARCFGFASEDFRIFNLSNYYFVPGFQEGNAIEVIKKLLGEIWNDSVSFYEDRVTINSRLIYQNPYGRWSFCKGKKEFVDKQVLEPDGSNILTFYCPRCERNNTSDVTWKEVDDNLICQQCVKEANTCEISNKLTFKELVMCLDANDQIKFAKQDIAEKMCRCSECNARCTNIYREDGKEICYDCKESQYSQCDICGKDIQDEKLESIGEYDLCEKCISYFSISRPTDFTTYMESIIFSLQEAEINE
jgi:hypothetical protein